MPNKRKKGFFDNDTTHGRVKRIMYKKYLQAYIPKTQYSNYRTVIIDGFAGEGRYGDNKEWPDEIDAYGSPLIALMVSLGMQDKKGVSEEKEKLSKKGTKQEKIEEDVGGANAPWASNQKRILYGWCKSELDPEEELDSEIKTTKSRKTIQKSLELESVQNRANISLIFYEMNSDIFKALSTNVELLIVKFLKKFYPSHTYRYYSSREVIEILLDTHPFSISVKLVNTEFQKTEPPATLTDKKVRSLTFIDPFGYTQTPMAHLKKYVPGDGNEIFINFMSSFVNRFVSRCPQGVVDSYGIDPPKEETGDEKQQGKGDACDNDRTKGQGKDDAFVEFVKQVIYEDRAIKEGSSTPRNIDKCTANYERYLKEKTDSKYSLVFELKDKRNITIYHMVHITNHIRGIEAMKEAMNRCSQFEGEMKMSAYDIDRKGHTLNLGNTDDHVKVADEVFKKFFGRRSVLLDEIKEFLLFDTPYLYRAAPLEYLNKKKKITSINDQDDKQRKGKGFPKENKDTRNPIRWYITFSSENDTNEEVGTSNEEVTSSTAEVKKRKRLTKEEQVEKKKQQEAKKQAEKVKKNQEKEQKEGQRLEEKRRKEEAKRAREEEKRVTKEEQVEKKKQQEAKKQAEKVKKNQQEKEQRERQRMEETRRKEEAKRAREEGKRVTKRKPIKLKIINSGAAMGNTDENGLKQALITDHFVTQKTSTMAVKSSEINNKENGETPLAEPQSNSDSENRKRKVQEEHSTIKRKRKASSGLDSPAVMMSVENTYPGEGNEDTD